MALQANYNFKGITIPNAYIRIERVFGGKKEGWNSVVAVYPEKPVIIPVIPVFDEDGIDITPEPVAPVGPVDTFNAGAPYSDIEPNAMSLIYAKLKSDLGASDA